jgi:hypothetical protein
LQRSWRSHRLTSTSSGLQLMANSPNLKFDNPKRFFLVSPG